MKNFNEQIKSRVNKANSEKKECKTINFHGNHIYWWAFPIGVVFTFWDEHKKRKFEKLEWSEEKAEQMINKYFGLICGIEQNGRVLYYNAGWRSRYVWTRVANRRDRNWVGKYAVELSKYIRNNFELEGYIKSIEEEDLDFDWVKFEKRA